MNPRMIPLGCACSWLALASAAQADPAPSQAAPSAALSEIVVTATKRSEKLHDVPMSVTAIGADQLASEAIHSTDDLVKAVPALGNNPNLGGGLVVRGVGTQAYSKSGEGSVDVVVDGVSLGTAISPLGATALFEVARVELLEGPQGTLFGRNSSAGVLNIVSVAPLIGRFESSAHADIATRDNQVLQGVVNAPLADTAALRLSAYWNNGPQIYTNALTGEHSFSESTGGRAHLLWRPTDNLTVNVIGDYDHTRLVLNDAAYSNATPGSFVSQQLAACGVTPGSKNSTECIDARSGGNIQTYGVSVQADYTLGAYTLTSISAGRGQTGVQGGDSDGLPVDLIDVNNDIFNVRNFSQELRLTSPSGARLEYVAGLYYANLNRIVSWMGEGYLTPELLSLGVLGGTLAHYAVGDKSYAAFFQGTYHVTQAFRLVAGGRLDREQVGEKSTAPVLPSGAAFLLVPYLPIDAKIGDTNLSYRFGGQYDLTRAIMLYATYTRGYKGPAFNEVPTSATTPIIVKPEIPEQVEIGAKANLFGNRLAANLALFDTDVTNFQTFAFSPASVAPQFTNVPSLKTRGFELNLNGRPLPGLTLNGGVAYVDAFYGSNYVTVCGPTQTAAEGCDPTTGTQNAAGRRATYSPRWKATFSGQYQRSLSEGLDGFIQADATYTSSTVFTPDDDPLSRVGAFLVLGARVGVRTADGRYGVSIFGRNLTDQRVPLWRASLSFGGDPAARLQTFGADSFRRIGVSLDAKF